MPFVVLWRCDERGGMQGIYRDVYKRQVEWLVSGSTLPAWATLTARSTSLITSEKMTGGISEIFINL